MRSITLPFHPTTPRTPSTRARAGGGGGTHSLPESEPSQGLCVQSVFLPVPHHRIKDMVRY